MKWQVGRVTITQFIEIETIGGKEYILPQATPEALRRLEWLRPQFADDDGRIKMSIHSFLVETPTRRIIVDTGIGNDKQNRRIPGWNGRNGPFLRDLAAAGCPAETIDTVLCTHLDVDHVGWNTTLAGGRWIPTFPRARYLMGRTEFERYDEKPNPSRDAIFDDSIRPVTDAELVDLVDPGHQVCEEVSLIATPGHSPGHLSAEVESQGQQALLVGDVAHHPCQLAHLDWSSTIDYDPAQSTRTRHDLFGRLAGTPTIILGGHFVGGTIVREDNAFRLAV
ncbi:MAG: MBL fold metallo-hydrolase [Xanthobacteraceae bacterium]|nr:MBL fold metallo-hydrolase [Xanthobacteraceae bacterium]